MIIDKFRDFNYKWIFQPWKSQLLKVRWPQQEEDNATKQQQKGASHPQDQSEDQNALPFIWVDTPETFMRIYDSFYLQPGGLARLDEMQRNTMRWWARAKQHFKALHEEAFCPLS